MARKTAAQVAEEQIKDQAFSELQALIEESEKLLKSSASLVGEEADTLRGQIAQKLQQARDSVTSVRDRTKPAVEATETYIGGHPWQTVAISAGFGLVVGLLLGRRNAPHLISTRKKASTQLAFFMPGFYADREYAGLRARPIPANSPTSERRAGCLRCWTWHVVGDVDPLANA